VIIGFPLAAGESNAMTRVMTPMANWLQKAGLDKATVSGKFFSTLLTIRSGKERKRSWLAMV
jgi:hypothetical protein